MLFSFSPFFSLTSINISSGEDREKKKRSLLGMCLCHQHFRRFSCTPEFEEPPIRGPALRHPWERPTGASRGDPTAHVPLELSGLSFSSLMHRGMPGKYSQLPKPEPLLSSGQLNQNAQR